LRSAGFADPGLKDPKIPKFQPVPFGQIVDDFIQKRLDDPPDLDAAVPGSLGNIGKSG
jgi:hypothetical protein